MDPVPDHGETSYVGSGRLKGRRALITGGDSGIGRAAAIAFAREGADVAIGFLPSEASDAEAVADLVGREGRKAVMIAGDVRDRDFCLAMVERANSELGGLDILVNNAGHQQTCSSILDLSDEQFDETIKTNLYSMFWITKAAVPLLPPGASIVNTCSTQAYSPVPNLLDYAMSKGGIAAFTKSLAKQLIERGIRVNAVAPGPFWTALQPSGGQPQEKVEQHGAPTAFGRPGQPAECAPIYVLLASAEASYITGEIYGITGGDGIA